MKIIERFDGLFHSECMAGKKTMVEGPFEKDSDLYSEKLAEGYELELMPQAEKDKHEQAQLIEQANTVLVSIAADIPQIEKDSWTTQEREAREWSADNTTSVPFIETLAAVRGVELSVLVEKILAKADAYSLAVATALGEKQKAEDNA